MFFLFALWGGKVKSQNTNYSLLKDITGATNNFAVTQPVDSGNIVLAPGFDQPVSSGNFKQQVAEFSADRKEEFFCPGPPIINSFSPISGPVGTVVTITGTGFEPFPANNIVFFGATKATVTAATTTSLTVTVPVGSTYQYITVTTTCNLTAYSSKSFITTFNCNGTITSSSYAQKVDFTSGTKPKWVSLGDLDGDGQADMAVPNQGSNILSIFRNTSIIGTVSFAPRLDIATPSEPNFVSTGDLDGDGKLDLVIPNYTGIGADISIFRNTSVTGSISFASRMDIIAGTNSVTASIGDLDGDGKPDLVITNWSANTLSVFRNTSSVGAISFAPKVDFITGNNPYGVSIGDLDGDGMPDLTVANAFSNTFSVYRNLSSIGTISLAPRVDYTTGTYSVGVSIGDLDGDGKADLAVSNFVSNTVSVFRNLSTTGIVTFAPKVDLITGIGPFSGISITDLDGDGKPDMAVDNYLSNSVSIFKNTGTSGTISFNAKIDFTTGTGPFGLAIGDIDGDNKPELVVPNWNANTVSVLRNTITPIKPSVNISVTPTGSICAGTPRSLLHR